MMFVSLCFATFKAGDDTYCQSGYKASAGGVCELDAAAIYPYKIVADTVPKGSGLMYRCPVSVAFDTESIASGLVRGGVRAFKAADYPTDVYGTHCRVCPPGTAPVLDEAESQAASLRKISSTFTAGGAPDLAGAIYTFKPVAVTCRRVKNAVENCDYYGADGNCAACAGTAVLAADGKCIPDVTAIGHCLRYAKDPKDGGVPAVHACAICEYRYYINADGTTCSPIPNCDASDLSSTADQSIRNKCTDCAKDYFYFQENPADFASQCVRSCPTDFIFSCETCREMEVTNCTEYDVATCGETLSCKVCAEGYYLKDSTTCRACDSACATCTGDQASDCTACAPAHAKSATTVVLEGTIETFTCAACPDNCAHCTDDNTDSCDADQCKSGYFSYTADDSKILCEKSGIECVNANNAIVGVETLLCNCSKRIPNCLYCVTTQVVGATENDPTKNDAVCKRCAAGFQPTVDGKDCIECQLKYCKQCRVEQIITTLVEGDGGATAPADTPVYTCKIDNIFDSCEDGYAWLVAEESDPDYIRPAANATKAEADAIVQPFQCRLQAKPAHCASYDLNRRCITCEHGFFVKPDGSCAWPHRCPRISFSADGKVSCDRAAMTSDEITAENCPKNGGEPRLISSDSGFCATFYPCSEYNEAGDMLCRDTDYSDADKKSFIKDGIVRPCYEGCETCVANPGNELMLGMFSKCLTCDQHGESTDPDKFAYYVDDNGACVPASVDHEFCTHVDGQSNAAECSACEVGFHLETDGGSPTCKPCPEHCTECDNAGDCIADKIEAGYYLDGSTVKSCAETYYDCLECDATQCTKTPENVSCEYDDTEDPKYGVCLPYGDQFCTKSKDKTTPGPANKYKVGDVLYNQECAECATGHYLEDNRCPLCVAKYGAMCAECDATRCTRCLGGLTMAPLVDGTSLPSTLTQCISCQERFGNDCMACDDLQCVKCGNTQAYDRKAQKCEAYTTVKCGSGCLRCEVDDFSQSAEAKVRCLRCTQGLPVGFDPAKPGDCGTKPDASTLPTACAETDYDGNCIGCFDRHSYAVKATAGEGVLKTCVHCTGNYGCFVDGEGILWEYTVDGVKGDQVTQIAPPVAP